MELQDCHINKLNQILFVFSDNKNNKILDINEARPEDYDLIAHGNRIFTINVHKRKCNISALESDGCLPIDCLDIPKNSASFRVNASPVYLTNCFVYIMELLFSPVYDNTFIRDSSIIDIPTNPEKMNDLLSRVFKSIGESDSTDTPNFDFKNIFHILLQQIISLEKQCSSNNVRMNKGLKKASINGGIANIHNVFDTIKDVVGIDKTLNQCADTIHQCMFDHREEVLNVVLNPTNGNYWAVKEARSRMHQTPLYYNSEISFKIMFAAVGEIFNALFLFIIPQYSMNESVMASFYQSAVLNELNMLKLFSDKIQLPIIYRLIRSCFKTDFNQAIISESESYLKNNYPSVMKNLERMRNTKFDDNISYLCTIAVASSIGDAQYTNSLFHILNETESRSVGFYLILLAAIYVQSKCFNLGKENKINNAKMFIEPLHKIIAIFGNHVQSIGLERALSEDVLNGFGQIYNDQLQEATAKFMSVIPNILSE